MKGVKKFIKQIQTKWTGKPFFNVDIEHPIIPAFVSGGVTYYMFEDIFNAPFNRSFEAQTFYNELQMKVDKEYLKQHVETVEAIISDPKGINIGDIALMNTQLKERLEFIVDADLLYKLASVLYFDETESPYKYDFAHGSKKIAKWKLENDIEDFFLNTPLRNFMPFLDTLEQDLAIYLRVTSQIKSEHQKTISKQSYKRKKKVGL